MRHQNKRTFRNFSSGDVALVGGDFFNRSAEMNGPGAPTRLRFPGNRRAQGIIDFENARRMPEIFQPPPITNRQSITGDARELPDRNVKENGARFRQLIEIVDLAIDFDFAPELAQITSERI